MARTFKSTDVAVLYRYMGDSIPVCTLKPLTRAYMMRSDGGAGNVTALTRTELALRLRLDKEFIASVSKAVLGTDEGRVQIQNVTPGVGEDGTGYVYVDFVSGTDVSRLTRPYAEAQGKRKRLNNIAISYWSAEDIAATKCDVMPQALAEELLAAITRTKAAFVSSASMIARWETMTTQAQAAITALEALGMDVPNELRVKANTAKPRSK